MASRQKEKERRRQERLEREREMAAAESRRRRLQFAFGGLLTVVLVAGIAVLASGALSGGGGKPSKAATAAGVKLPPARIANLQQAAKAAGCTVRTYPIEGRTHETKQFTEADYKTNPPTSGNHNPTWYQDGIYEPGGTPQLGMLVHTLEHGRIDVQYKPGTSKKVERQLEALLAQQDQGYHMLLFQNTTHMPYAVAATAWGHLAGCRKMNDKVFDVLRDFRDAYIDKGPEKIP